MDVATCLLVWWSLRPAACDRRVSEETKGGEQVARSRLK